MTQCKELWSLYDVMPDEDWRIVERFLPGARRGYPDVVLAPDGKPYLYRWYLVPNDKASGNIMFHLQVASDPERPLHDHPWDNTSVILSGGYSEIMDPFPEDDLPPFLLDRKVGDVIYRRAEVAHRLILPEGVPYTMTLFTTGPKRREWGFWYPDGWHDAKRHVNDRADGTSVHTEDQK